jgi:hypothetical protein
MNVKFSSYGKESIPSFDDMFPGTRLAANKMLETGRWLCPQPNQKANIEIIQNTDNTTHELASLHKHQANYTIED